MCRSFCCSTKGRRIVLWMLLGAMVLGTLTIVAVGVVNVLVCHTTKGRIVDMQAAAELTDIDYVLVLGAGVKADGSPTDMLRDRIVTGVQIVKAGATGELLMSGDNQYPEYDEVSAMVDLALDMEIDETLIQTDRLGLSTYESLTRAKELYGAKRVIIVTQEYHLYRALYIADALGIEAHGVSADLHTYRGQFLRDLREIAARCKDFLLVHLQ